MDIDMWMQSKQWQNIAKAASGLNLSDLWQQDPERDLKFVQQCSGIYFDYSRQCVSEQLMTALFEFARARDANRYIESIARGEQVNAQEARAAWHIMARGKSEAMPPELIDADLAMQNWIEQIRSGAWRGAFDKKIDTIISVGIGGSLYGPKLLVDVLSDSECLQCHFVSSIETREAERVLEQCDPQTTVCVLISKSFTSQETLFNAQLIKQWYETASVGMQHIFAVTNAANKALEFAVEPEKILPFAKEIGGRFSVWSTGGFSAALVLGWNKFAELRAGAKEIDEHVLGAAIEENIPLTMALLSVNSLYMQGYQSQAIVSYAESTNGLLDYLQQLHMESLGKCTTASGAILENYKAPIIWGGVGSSSEHTFHQQLLQAECHAPIDFVVPLDLNSSAESELARCAHAVAQSEALLWGAEKGDVDCYLPGSRAASYILLNKLDAKHLGCLLSIYEHKVHYYAALFEINPFDQCAVEVAKKIYRKLLHAKTVQPATARLWQRCVLGINDE